MPFEDARLIAEVCEFVLTQSGEGKLDSALNAPFAEFDGFALYPTFEEKAAVIWCRVSNSHSLIDGNKRLGLICLLYFCFINQYVAFGSDADFIRVALWTADHKYTEKQVYQWLRTKIRKAEE